MLAIDVKMQKFEPDTKFFMTDERMQCVNIIDTMRGYYFFGFSVHSKCLER